MFFSSALICAIWFAWTGMFWIYWAAIFIAYPGGFISLVLWNLGRKTDRKLKRYKLIPIILLLGLTLSLGTLIFLLIFD
jgi:hypothetical protein